MGKEEEREGEARHRAGYHSTVAALPAAAAAGEWMELPVLHLLLLPPPPLLLLLPPAH